ncbi:hypothetical protein P615_16610 [Brevibacillus laterosporus PE36]|nr:hypothetical protein P615_16610 [Brevibacillus laterosporus PE36]
MIHAVQFDIRMAELEVTNRLKKQAQDEWNRLPEGERYRKKGLFGLKLSKLIFGRCNFCIRLYRILGCDFICKSLSRD